MQEFFMNDRENKSGMFCSVCNLMLRDAYDAETYEKFNCCNSCYLRWIESRIDSWKDGWRPDKKDIEEYKSTARIIRIN